MSLLKVKITRPGVNNNVGEIKVGQIIEVDGVGVDGNELPGFLVNKCVIIGDDEGRDLKADNADIEALKSEVEILRADNDSLVLQLESAKEEIEGLRDTLRDSFKELAGKDSDKRWGLAKLREEVATLKAKA